MTHARKKVLVTGADGFIGKNLVAHLRESGGFEVVKFVRKNKLSDLDALVEKVDFIVHLAGENRPSNPEDFTSVNVGLTISIADSIRREFRDKQRRVGIIFASSAQATEKNPYGNSKLAAEKCLMELGLELDIPVKVFRLPGVFGKWSKPNYNSVVATYCYNIARQIPIKIDDPDKNLRLVYIDDVISAFMVALKNPNERRESYAVQPEYYIRLGDLAEKISSFKDSRENLISGPVGSGILRALYATYVSFLPKEQFAYPLKSNADQRGVFVEFLKTEDSGQFSFFTALPKVTRGGHYHHTKSEKFLVVKGEALFRFKHLVTGETFELKTSSAIPEVVDTIPGWSHDITNIGDEELVVMLWANEIFNKERPDTFASEL